jgi:hypothetical protein
MFNKKINKLLSEFINKQSQEELITFLTENQKIISSLNNDFLFFNSNEQLPDELWNTLKENFKKIVKHPDFQKKSKKVNCKLYALKFFSKITLGVNEDIEEILKFETKKYYSQLATEDSEEFINNFFNLPFEYVSLVIIYLSNFLCKEDKNNLAPKLETAQKYFNELKKQKNKLLITLNNISLGKEVNLPFGEIKELIEVRAFFDYNPLNVGALEYIVRLLNNETSRNKLIELYGVKTIDTLKQEALLTPCYIKHLEEIRDGLTTPYFTSSGMQNTNRDMTFDDYINKYFFPDQYIPKETEIKTDEQPEESEPELEITAEQPSPEELNPDEETPEEGEEKVVA